ADGTRRRVHPEGLVVSAAGVVAGEPEPCRRPQDEQGGGGGGPAGPPGGAGPGTRMRPGAQELRGGGGGEIRGKGGGTTPATGPGGEAAEGLRPDNVEWGRAPPGVPPLRLTERAYG